MAHYTQVRIGSHDPDYGVFSGHPMDPRSSDGPCECEACQASGKVTIVEEDDGPTETTCEACNGTGWLDEDGQSYDPNQSHEPEPEFYD